ncbi:MAG: response regulator transcription factor [Arcobacteraceae bacterium]
MYSGIRNLNILYVEDDEVISKTFVQVFERLGASVVSAATYNDAVKHFNYGSNNFNIIITDVMFDSDDNGLDFVHLVRTFDKLIKVIVVSAHDKSEYLMRSLDLNINKYFIKPFKESILFEYLNKIGDNLESYIVEVKEKNDHVHMIEDFYYSPSKKCFVQNGKDIVLTAQESYFVELLLDKKSQIVTYEEIEARVKKDTKKNIARTTIRTIIKNLRKKTTYSMITLISNIGYKIG